MGGWMNNATLLEHPTRNVRATTLCETGILIKTNPVLWLKKCSEDRKWGRRTTTTRRRMGVVFIAKYLWCLVMVFNAPKIKIGGILHHYWRAKFPFASATFSRLDHFHRFLDSLLPFPRETCIMEFLKQKMKFSLSICGLLIEPFWVKWEMNILLL